MTINPVDFYLELDNYSIFDLMGLHDLSDNNKRIMLIDMNSLVWANFAREKLPNILTREQLQEVSNQLVANRTFEEVVKTITNYNPNFSQILMEYTRIFKADFLKRHYEAEVKQCEDLMRAQLSPDNQNMLRTKREKFVRGIELSTRGEWILLYELFSEQQIAESP